MSEAPTVFCPKEGKKVPVWHCTGSFVQQREMCPELIKITVRPTGDSEVKCKLQKRDRTLKFMVLFRIGDFIFIFGHVSQLKGAVYQTIVKEKRR